MNNIKFPSLGQTKYTKPETKQQKTISESNPELQDYPDRSLDNLSLSSFCCISRGCHSDNKNNDSKFLTIKEQLLEQRNEKLRKARLELKKQLANPQGVSQEVIIQTYLNNVDAINKSYNDNLKTIRI